MGKNEKYVLDERHHAYLIGLFYQVLRERRGADGIHCFVKATQFIAEQRGRRMALRALRDGKPLDYSTYMAYGEISFTLPNESQSVGEGLDCQLQVSRCVWQQVFQEMGLTDCGLTYCPQIDRGIVRGFNPDLQFELKSTLHDSPCCDLVFKEAALYAVEPPEDGKRSWNYHCGHYYYGYSRCIQMVFADREELVRQVEEQFAQQYGKSALEAVLRWKTVCFEDIDP